jgi:hypothetical protein
MTQISDIVVKRSNKELGLPLITPIINGWGIADLIWRDFSYNFYKKIIKLLIVQKRQCEKTCKFSSLLIPSVSCCFSVKKTSTLLIREYMKSSQFLG